MKRRMQKFSLLKPERFLKKKYMMLFNIIDQAFSVFTSGNVPSH